MWLMVFSSSIDIQMDLLSLKARKSEKRRVSIWRYQIEKKWYILYLWYNCLRVPDKSPYSYLVPAKGSSLRTQDFLDNFQPCFGSQLWNLILKGNTKAKKWTKVYQSDSDPQYHHVSVPKSMLVCTNSSSLRTELLIENLASYISSKSGMKFEIWETFSKQNKKKLYKNQNITSFIKQPLCGKSP